MSEGSRRCGLAKCFAHDGETCAIGYMTREACPRWHDGQTPPEATSVEPLTAEEIGALGATADWVGFAIEPYDNTGPVTIAAEDAGRIADMAAMAKRMRAAIDARDKTIAERDAEIARLRERIAKAAVYVAAHHAYRAILDAPPRARIHAQPIDERRANLEIVRAREKAHVDMIAAFDQD